MLFSVIVPAYQVEKYLVECIDSIIGQCVDETEIIIVDDGSRDRTGKIADHYASISNSIRVIHQENQGLSAARNAGIICAKGEYCVFVDGDDLLCKGALNSLRNCIKRNSSPEIIVHKMKTVDSEGNIKECRYRFDQEEGNKLNGVDMYVYLDELKDFAFSAWIFSVKRDYIINNHFLFYEGILHEDEEWVPKTLMNANSTAVNNSFFYCYRINRDGSIMIKKNIKREFDKLEIINLLDKEFSDKKYTDKQREMIKKRECSLYFGVVSEAIQYKEDEEYTELIMKLKEGKEILKQDHRLSHIVCNIIIRLFGIEIACALLGKAVRFKK